MGEGTVSANGIRLWYEDFGDPADPHVVLVMGTATTAMAWHPALYEPIVAAGFHVVRFDNRDVGLSEWFDFEARPYTLDDMAADAVGLMDALSITRAHVIGASMGGMIAQLLALNHPDRVHTLTSVCSSPDPTDPDLPPPRHDIVEVMLTPLPASRDGVVDQRIEIYRAIAGTRLAFDEPRWRTVFETDMDRGFNPNPGHVLAQLAAPSRRDALRDLRVPTLVIHGDADPLLPYEHGVATAEAIPAAKLVTITGTGHIDVLDPLDETLPPILEHLTTTA